MRGWFEENTPSGGESGQSVAHLSDDGGRFSKLSRIRADFSCDQKRQTHMIVTSACIQRRCPTLNSERTEISCEGSGIGLIFLLFSTHTNRNHTCYVLIFRMTTSQGSHHFSGTFPWGSACVLCRVLSFPSLSLSLSRVSCVVFVWHVRVQLERYAC